MTITSEISEPQSLYELSWTYAQDGKIAIDDVAGTILDANPAMEALTGYSRAELIGMHVTMLHPEAERERVKAEFRKVMLRGLAPFRFSHPAQRWKLGASRDLVVGEAKAGRSELCHWRVPRYYCVTIRREASGADGGQIPGASGGGSRWNGGGESGRGDCPAECPGGEAVWLPPR